MENKFTRDAYKQVVYQMKNMKELEIFEIEYNLLKEEQNKEIFHIIYLMNLQKNYYNKNVIIAEHLSL